MCGICGVLYADTTRPADRALVRKMCDAIIHRGPDDDGYHVQGSVGLGVRRLSIIDLEGGGQPIRNEDGTLHVVYNGEIYNYRELKSGLEAKGHLFATRSDTEVIVHAYEEAGERCLDRLRGMFAFALWDERRRSLLLAVDRFGIKPLYYAATSAGMAFGSELKCLLRSGLVERDLDLDALAQYFTLNYVPPPATIFTEIRKLSPGSLLRWTPEGGAVVRQYWETPRDEPETLPSPSETRRLLREMLSDAVRSHLVSDVPVGAFLSGGIDSSAVVALMSEASEEPVRTFSIGFNDPRFSELAKARVVANQYGTDHHELIVEPEAIDLLPRLVAHFDEPFADASALPTYYVSKLASEHVKVALSGDGGDELFLGYTSFRGLELARYAQVLPAPVRHVVGRLPNLIPRTGSTVWNDRLALVAKRAADTMLPPDAAFRRKLTSTGLGAVGPFLSVEWRRALETRDPYAVVNHWLSRYASSDGAHPLERFVYTGFQVSLAGDMLVKVDRASMANSLEVRVPLLDHLLAEHVATIPLARRFPRWRLKGLLKDTMADTLPPKLLDQRKQGFNVPLSAWFRGDLADFARDVLTSQEARGRGFLDIGAIDGLLRRHREGKHDVGSVIWALLVFELWCRHALTS